MFVDPALPNMEPDWGGGGLANNFLSEGILLGSMPGARNRKSGSGHIHVPLPVVLTQDEITRPIIRGVVPPKVV